MKLKKGIALLLVALLCVGTCGCAKKSANNSESGNKFTWFVPMYNGNVIQNAGDQYCWQEIQKRTGTTIEFIHPPAGSENDTFNVRVASGDLPDIITWSWVSNFAGGPTKAISDGIIIDISDYMDDAPNYSAILDSIPGARSTATLDDGAIYGFTQPTTDAIISASEGFVLREDWLKKVGMEAPTTIDEWHDVLTAFKTQDPNGNGKADEIPFICTKEAQLSAFATAWGVRSTYHPDPAQGGKIVYGPTTPAYKEFLTEMAKWYKEGLIDAEFPVNARKNVDEKVTTSVAGSFYGLIGSQLGSYNIEGSNQSKDFSLIGVNNPVAQNGVAYSNNDALLQRSGNQCVSVSTKNKHPKETVQLIDYIYGDEGRMLMNWGKEGESYEIVDGKPQYTDLIMNNPEGKTRLDAVAQYAVPMFGYFTPFYLDSYSSINLTLPQQQSAGALWAEMDTSLCMPFLFPNDDEAAVISKKGADITTYASECLVKFVIGQKPLSEFDSYVEEMERMGVKDLVKVYQAMYDRYLKKLS